MNCPPFAHHLTISGLLFRLDEISATAAKEYSLERSLAKMKFEWKDMCFEFVQYRDSVSSCTVQILPQRCRSTAFECSTL